jgi:hypothetical protein
MLCYTSFVACCADYDCCSHVKVLVLVFLMNSEELLLLSRRLEVMKRRSVSAVLGAAPGISDQELVELWSLDPLSGGDGDESSRANLVGSVGEDAQASSISAAPTIAEYEDAVQNDVDSMSGQQCLRALVKQNNILLRDALCRHRRPVRQRSDGGVVVAPANGSSGGSVHVLLSSTDDSSLVSSSATSGSVHSSRGSPGVPKKSPPKCFVCPCCKKPKNEKCFDRHVAGWIGKVGRTLWRSGQCRGIQDIHHPLLSTFSEGSLADRVRCVVRDIRSLLHPGAYDANSPEGSGRHVLVAARFVELGYTGSDQFE